MFSFFEIQQNYSKLFFRILFQSMEPTLTQTSSKAVSSGRYLSLDVLRGMTIALMIVVNTPGSWQHIYAPLRHAEWHGFTLTDLVFPLFLFVVGNAMSFSMRKYATKNDAVVLGKLFKRAGIIFLIGFLLNYFPFLIREADGAIVLKDITQVRIMGVLQRIALCYLIAGLIIHYFNIKGAVTASVVLLFFYWAVMYFFGDSGGPYSLESNAALKLDTFIFPDENLYRGFGIPFDPEGLLSTIPAVVNVLVGFLVGVYIQSSKSIKDKIMLLALGGVLLVVIGLIWDIFFPINKPLWTSSYVLYTLGWSLLVLSGFMTIIELLKFTSWTYFFEVFGKNPLFIYILSGVFIQTLIFIRIGGESLNSLIYKNLFLSWADGKNASLLFAISYTLVLWLVGLWMMRRRIFIKV